MAWRKSWSKENIYGKKGNGECTKRALLPEERSVLDDYLDLAELSPVKGSVCIANNIGYSPQQLALILNTPINVIESAEMKLLNTGVITIHNRVITFVKWFHYQSEYGRQLHYRVTRSGYNKVLPTDTEADTEADTDKKNNKKSSTRTPKAQLPNDLFLEKIRKNYDWVDMDTEFKKMDTWLLAHPGRQKTQRFIVNWLNKVDRPVPGFCARRITA